MTKTTSPPTTRLRRLAPADASAYRALMLNAYEREPDAFTSTAAERAVLPRAWWESRLSSDAAAWEIVMGAFRGPHLVGAVGLTFELRTKVRHKVTLFGMYVSPVARKTGIGRLLVEASLALAAGRAGIRVVQLTVTQGNVAAIALYEGCGFKEFGVEPMAILAGDRSLSKVHMWYDIPQTGRPRCDPSGASGGRRPGHG